MPDTIITPSGLEADVGQLINRVADAVTHLRRVAAQLEGAGDTDPQFFDLIRAVSSSATESAYYGRACLNHLQQLLGTDRRSARGAPPRQQERAQDLQPAAAQHPAPAHTDAALIAELTTSCFPDQTHQSTRDESAPPHTTRTGSVLLPPPQLPLMTRPTPEVA
jgi:hypothetical protein